MLYWALRPVLMPDKIKSYIRQDDYIICADGGLRTAQRMGIRPDLLIGDFDSMEQPACRPAETITLPVCKDDTDMMAGIKEGNHPGVETLFVAGRHRGADGSHDSQPMRFGFFGPAGNGKLAGG